MIRLLVGLTVVQILALGLLATEMMTLQGELQRLSAGSSTAPPTLTRNAPDVRTADDLPETATLVMARDETLAAIRATVREELEYALAGLSRESSAQPAEQAALSEEESLDRFQVTTSTIDAYTQAGRISTQDMTSLQQQIAKLKPEHRTEALRHLFRAMNSGQLDARL